MPADVYRPAVQLTLESARAVVRAVLEEGRRLELEPLTVVVLDGGGHAVAMEREDGSGILRQEVATGKAYGALGIGLGSRTIAGRNQGRDAFLASVAAASDGKFVPVPGGVLLLDEQAHAIGAVGVSGDASDADEAAAIAGIKAAGLRPGNDPTAES